MQDANIRGKQNFTVCTQWRIKFNLL